MNDTKLSKQATWEELELAKLAQLTYWGWRHISPKSSTSGLTEMTIRQYDLLLWERRNFGLQPSWTSVLGIVEEYGELGEATTAENDAEITDAIGDVLVFACNLCSKNGLDFDTILSYAELLREESKEIYWIFDLGKLAHVTLKASQGIRGYEDRETCRRDICIALSRVLCELVRYSWQTGWDPREVFYSVSELVMKRDWTKSTVTREWNFCAKCGKGRECPEESFVCRYCLSTESTVDPPDEAMAEWDRVHDVATGEMVKIFNEAREEREWFSEDRLGGDLEVDENGEFKIIDGVKYFKRAVERHLMPKRKPAVNRTFDPATAIGKELDEIGEAIGVPRRDDPDATYRLRIWNNVKPPPSAEDQMHWAPDNKTAACGRQVGQDGFPRFPHWINNPNREGPIEVTCNECASKRRETGLLVAKQPDDDPPPSITFYSGGEEVEKVLLPESERCRLPKPVVVEVPIEDLGTPPASQCSCDLDGCFICNPAF